MHGKEGRIRKLKYHTGYIGHYKEIPYNTLLIN